MPARYVANKSQTAAMLRSDLLGPACLDVAKLGHQAAVLFSPHRTGEYARSFNAEKATILVNGQPRTGAILENTSDVATLVEWGRGPDANGRGAYSGDKVMTRTLELMRKGF